MGVQLTSARPDDVKRLALLVRSILEIAKASGSVGGIDLTKVRIDELLMRIPGEMKKISQLYDVKLLLHYELFSRNTCCVLSSSQFDDFF